MKKEMVFLMGAPAAGKSTLGRKKFGATHIFIDCDQIKEQHPDYDPARPDLIHEWSSAIAKQMFQDAINSQDGLWVIDSTGTNAERMVKDIKLAKDAGFKTTLFYVRCSLETSLRRAAKRKRRVPEYIIREKHSLIATSFEIVSKYADTVEVVDNGQDKEKK